MVLTANAEIQILKPTSVVFKAIVEPEMMRNYFIAHSTGKLQQGITVSWSFPEFQGTFPVTAKEIKIDSYISFDWSGGEKNQLVEIFLSSTKEDNTIVKIVENQMDESLDGIQKMKKQTEGWANFLACLKAFLEYGINLRKGAFDYMQNNG
ncbi:ATPase [Sphingobacterium shayense]|uniref:SRPBCC domain-containing protein n=1 Tax=Sphingobacterium shayense TaxID=626343 RepID=UPI0015582D81|nr:SRPBCC domain-containing protein [Sphingobacterium shayense]NQD70564.1 ATPase [Sphingobacterium shayense]